MKIDGVRVHNRKGQGQALPDLANSLYKIPFNFVAGRTYRIRVEYSNTYYAGTSDIDGATLFAYSEWTFKEWNPSPPIEVGEIEAPTDGVAKTTPNGHIALRVGTATDSDTWTQGTQSGEASEAVSYHWTGAGSFADANAAATQWTAPNVTSSQTFTLTCTVDDANTPVGANEIGSRNDAPETRTVRVTVAPPCSITLFASELEWNSVLMQWSRCKDDDFVSYKLYRSTASAGFSPDQSNYRSRVSSDETNQDLTSYKDTGLLPLTTYYYALVTSHCGTTTTARKTITTPDKPPFEVKFADDQLSRSCAGGIGVDGVHSFVIEGVAKNEDGTVVPNTSLELSFANNRGHDYSNDADGVKPAGWTTAQMKKAKFVIRDANNNVIDLVETLTRSTDANGKIKVEVLSSDIVSSDIEIKLKWKNSQNELKDVGSKACDFDEAVGFRNFLDENNPDDTDEGWLFNKKYLGDLNDETTLKIYTKFMIKKEDGNVSGNWKGVNGHRISIGVESVETKDGSEAMDNNQYITVLPNTDGSQVFSTRNDGQMDGAATCIVRAEAEIDGADTVWFSGYDLSQWGN